MNFILDWQLFWKQHYQRQRIEDTLNATTDKKTWDFWVKFFGLEVVKDHFDTAIDEMKEKAARLRRSAKKR